MTACIVYKTEATQLLWQHFKTQGCQKAREQLIERHRHLAQITAGKLFKALPAHIERADLLSDAFVGLIKAVDNFDPGRNVKFTTFAIALIRGAILEGLREADWVPRTVRERAKQIAAAEQDFEAGTGRLPDEAELEAALGWTPAKLLQERTLCERARLVSLSEPTYVDAGVTLRVEDALMSAAPGSWEAAWKAQRTGLLSEQVDRLPARERAVMILYYAQRRTFAEIGQGLGVSESRAYQLHGQALRRMRGYVLGNEEAFV